MAAPLLATSALRVQLNHLSMGRIGHLLWIFSNSGNPVMLEFVSEPLELRLLTPAFQTPSPPVIARLLLRKKKVVLIF
jgi:hypothetical protein